MEPQDRLTPAQEALLAALLAAAAVQPGSGVFILAQHGDALVAYHRNDHRHAPVVVDRPELEALRDRGYLGLGAQSCYLEDRARRWGERR